MVIFLSLSLRQWSCPTCTQNNSIYALQCPACFMPNPQPAVINVTEDQVHDVAEDEPIGATAWDEMGDDWVCHYCFISNPGTSLNCLHCEEDPCVDKRYRTSGTFDSPLREWSMGRGIRQQLLTTGGNVGVQQTQHHAASVSIGFVDDIMPVTPFQL